MSDLIEIGRVFIKEGTILPDSLRLESEPYMSGWRLVKTLDGESLGKQIQEAGWTFFSLAGEIRATVFDRESQNVLRRAARRILHKLKLEKFNCVQISGVATEHLLGVPYMIVSAHSRHIQESKFLFRATEPKEWDLGTKAAA